jgi:hypothetical protein
MRLFLLLLPLASCAEPCLRSYASIAPPAHTDSSRAGAAPASYECMNLPCDSADSLEEWTEELPNDETGGTLRVKHAVCSWECVGLSNGKRARVEQHYQRAQAEGECIELVDETLDTRRASCNRECEVGG